MTNSAEGGMSSKHTLCCPWPIQFSPPPQMCMCSYMQQRESFFHFLYSAHTPIQTERFVPDLFPRDDNLMGCRCAGFLIWNVLSIQFCAPTMGRDVRQIKIWKNTVTVERRNALEKWGRFGSKIFVLKENFNLISWKRQPKNNLPLNILCCWQP